MYRATIYLLTVASMLLSTQGLADDSYQGQFTIGADLGVGRVEVQQGDIDNSHTWLYGALSAEYFVLDHLALGLEGVGWTDQATTNSPISEDIFSVMMIARYFPFNDDGMNFKAGWGYAKHRMWNSPDSNDTSGESFVVGLGLGLGVSLDVSYSWGNLDQEDYNALTISVGATF